jgi:hypothetical protein
MPLTYEVFVSDGVPRPLNCSRRTAVPSCLFFLEVPDRAMSSGTVTTKREARIERSPTTHPNAS